MCASYDPAAEIDFEAFTQFPKPKFDFPAETWKDYREPMLRSDAGELLTDPATFGMVPRAHIPPGVRLFDTIHDRSLSAKVAGRSVTAFRRNARGDGRLQAGTAIRAASLPASRRPLPTLAVLPPNGLQLVRFAVIRDSAQSNIGFHERRMRLGKLGLLLAKG